MIVEKQLTKADAIKAYLARAHAESKKATICYPDEYGAFPGSWLNAVLHGESLLVVPDTNVLLTDIGRACSRVERTVLVTAANSGALRLFCAQHVLDEVLKHSEESADAYNVPHEVYLSRWREEYLPLMRTVQDRELPVSLLTPNEAERLRSLEVQSSRDIPSVILTLALGAFYLTQDRAARYAAYGQDVENEELRKWLLVLMDGGNVGELGKTLFGALAIPGLAVSGLLHGIGSLVKKSPWVLFAVGAPLAFLAFRTPSRTYKKIGHGLLEVGSFLAELYRPYSEALDRFRKMAPTVPTWHELSQTNERRLVLARACMYNLARAPRSLLSAQELADALPTLGVGQDTQLVRSTLRSYGCFDQPYRGRWQVGRAVVRAKVCGATSVYH